MTRNKAKWTVSAVVAGGLLITGIAVGGSPTPASHPKTKAAASVTGEYANLDACPTLALNYQGGCAEQLQVELNAVLDTHLTPDGFFGPATQQAVETFQEAHQISPDGKVGPQTKAALDSAIGNATPITPVTPASAPAAGLPSSSAPATSAPATSTPATSTPATAQPLQYVALGDSYSSGEGLDPFLPGTDTATDSCHRSTQAYSQYVTPKPDWFYACSGQTEATLTTPAMNGQEQPQELHLNQGTGLVTFTFGGNDLDWTSTLLDCTKVQSAVLHNTWFYSSNACNQDTSGMPGRISSMETSLVTAYTRVLSDAPNAQVRVLTYPPLFPDRGDSSSGCRIGRLGPTQLVIASDVERQVVGLEQKANAAIASAVQQVQATTPGGSRLQLVDVTPQFGGYQGHTASCGDNGRPTPWINSLRASGTGAERTDWNQAVVDATAHRWSQLMNNDLFDVYSASFHPTHDGQYAMYLALKATLPAGWQ